MTTAYATSEDGLAWAWRGTALAPRPGTWDARGARVTAVLPDGRAYYDGRQDWLNNPDVVVNRPPGILYQPGDIWGSVGAWVSVSHVSRKAARVFPEPVGAWMRTCPPEAIAGQPCSCAGVGAANAEVNHDRVIGENRSSAATGTAAAASIDSRADAIQDAATGR